MRIFLSIACCLVLPSALFAQTFSFPDLHRSATSIADFLPPDWIIKDSVSGDLNGDKIPDKALVLEYTDTVTELRPDSIEETNKPRILLVLLWDPAKHVYRTAVQNNTFILRASEGGMVGDPYNDGLSIKNEILLIGFDYLHGGLSYKFRFQANDFFLIGATSYGSSPAHENFDEWDVNFLTGKAKHTSGHLAGGKDRVEWKQIKTRSLIKMKNMKMPHELEIFPDVFI